MTKHKKTALDKNKDEKKTLRKLAKKKLQNRNNVSYSDTVNEA